MSLLPVGFGASGDDYEITDSLRLRSASDAYLSRTFSTPTNNKKWSYSVWMKRGTLSTNQAIISSNVDGANYWDMRFNTSDQIYIQNRVSSSNLLVANTTAVYRDPSSWYHIMFVFDSANSTASNRNRLYINSVEQTLSANSGSSNASAWNVNAVQHNLGVARTLSSSGAIWAEYDGYQTEINFIDGQALAPTDFGEYDANGTWKAKDYTGTYGNNGFYLPMKPTTQATGFNTVLYTGTGGTQSINGVGFSSSPDLVWIKNRSGAASHIQVDSVRGIGAELSSNSTGAETSNGTTRFASFDSDGFTFASTAASSLNASGNTYVAWCWDAGSGSAGTNTDGDINSTVKANTTSGFSIVSYTGNNTSGATVGHGLGVAPSMVICKNRTAGNGSGAWPVWHSSLSSVTSYVFLNTTAAQASGNNNFTAAPTSTVLKLGTSDTNNTATMVAYCFAEVAGYSKFGTYTGNGSANGPVVTTGFRVGFLLVKRTDTTNNWLVHDNTRNPNNPVVNGLIPNLANAEFVGNSANYGFEFQADGFKAIGTTGGGNDNNGTYIYMAFADTADARFNFDASGNQNNWEPNNINSNGESETTYDLMKDTPSLVDTNAGNFCTLSPISKHASSSTTNGNLTGTTTTASDQMILSTFAVSSGKWYWEVVSSAQGSAGCMVGVRASYLGFAGSLLSATDGYAYYPNGSKYSVAGGASYGASWTNGDVIGIALDLDNGTIAFYKNNASQGTAFTGISGTYTPGVSNGGATSSSTFVINFGQRPFEYTPPSGFLKLNTFNLPDSTIEKGDEYFTPVLYTGNNASGRNIPTGFPGGWTWIKNRNAANSHTLSDVVRGDGKTLFTNATNAEVDYGSNGIDLVSDGFDVTHSATNNLFNVTGRTYVAWNWRAGSTATNSAGANGATIASTYSANTTSGFSVVSWSGNSTNGATVGHLLGAAPSLIITKCRSHATSWVVGIGGISGFGVNDYLTLQTTSQKNASSTFYQAYSANTFQVGVSSADEMNKTGRTYISYCFAEVPGYSAIGSYTGNGSADGTFVHLNFRPSWLLIKQTNGGSFNWNLIDTSRSPFNTADDLLAPNANNAEVVSGFVDAVSNGFKCRNSSAYVNGSGSTYIYMAFAENPFKNSNAR